MTCSGHATQSWEHGTQGTVYTLSRKESYVCPLLRFPSSAVFWWWEKYVPKGDRLSKKDSGEKTILGLSGLLRAKRALFSFLVSVSRTAFVGTLVGHRDCPFWAKGFLCFISVRSAATSGSRNGNGIGVG